MNGATAESSTGHARQGARPRCRGRGAGYLADERVSGLLIRLIGVAFLVTLTGPGCSGDTSRDGDRWSEICDQVDECESDDEGSPRSDGNTRSDSSADGDGTGTGTSRDATESTDADGGSDTDASSGTDAPHTEDASDDHDTGADTGDDGSSSGVRIPDALEGCSCAGEGVRCVDMGSRDWGPMATCVSEDPDLCSGLEEGDTCSEGFSCRSGRCICNSLSCQPACEGPEDCGRYGRCHLELRVCVPTRWCANRTLCDPGETCAALDGESACQPTGSAPVDSPCTRGVDCASGTCWNGFCHQECLWNGDCPEHLVCELVHSTGGPGMCVERTEDMGCEQVCAPTDPDCEPEPRCRSVGHEERCTPCGRLCRTNGDCPGGHCPWTFRMEFPVCAEGAMPECAPDEAVFVSDVLPASGCTRGAPCMTSADCAPDEQCYLGITCYRPFAEDGE